MTTKKQIIANRRNAQKSTGPKSPLGKTISSRNSTAHGFYSTSILLPNEDREQFLRLARRLAYAYSPSGVLEEEQVRIIIETCWQLRRADIVDTELFQIYRFYKGEERGVGTAFAQDASQTNSFSKLVRYESFLMRKRQLAEKEFARLRSASMCASEPTKNRDIETQTNSLPSAASTATKTLENQLPSSADSTANPLK